MEKYQGIFKADSEEASREKVRSLFCVPREDFSSVEIIFASFFIKKVNKYSCEGRAMVLIRQEDALYMTEGEICWGVFDMDDCWEPEKVSIQDLESYLKDEDNFKINRCKTALQKTIRNLKKNP